LSDRRVWPGSDWRAPGEVLSNQNVGNFVLCYTEYISVFWKDCSSGEPGSNQGGKELPHAE
jgi:hypothetical protein